MNYKGTTRLETERLILRRFEITDADDMFENYASSDNVTKYMTQETHSNIDVTREYLQSLTKSYSDGKVFDWAIKLKNENKVIGSIGVKNLMKVYQKLKQDIVQARNGGIVELLRKHLKKLLDSFLKKQVLTELKLIMT